MSIFHGIPLPPYPVRRGLELEKVLTSDELELRALHSQSLTAKDEAAQRELEDPDLRDVARALTA